MPSNTDFSSDKKKVAETLLREGVGENYGKPRVSAAARMMKNDEIFDKIISPSAVIK